MPGDGEAYELALMEEAAEAVADTEEEAAELLNFAKPTSMMTKEEQLIMFAKVLRDDKRAQLSHTAELKRTNDLYEAAQKRWIWLFAHTGRCVAEFFKAMQQPKLLIPTVATVAFMTLIAVGQGDRALDIAESLLEHYLSVDIHGHNDVAP